MSLKKIAQASGVSVSTVSKAFSGSPEISPETRKKVIEVSKKLGCFEKYTKEKYPEKIIGVICPELGSEHYTNLLTNLEREITARNAIMVVSVSNFDKKREEELFRYYSNFRKADGIIIISSVDFSNFSGIPTVVMGESKTADCVFVDSSEAINDAVRYLKKTGRKKIAFIGEELTVAREKMFENAMEKNAVAVMNKFVISTKKRFHDAGFCAAEHFFQNGDFPDAIVAAYDYIAIGAIRALKAHGKKVPDDVAVIGMDNISAGEDLDIPLATIDYHDEQISRIAVDMLFDAFSKRRPEKYKSIAVKSDLIIRDSAKNISG